jgi:hypothetical protein
MPRVEMFLFVHKLVLPIVTCLAVGLAACTVEHRSYEQLARAREAYTAPAVLDAYDVAQAAARSEIADRRVAVELLRELANRYRILGREKVLTDLGAALEREGSTVSVVSAQLQATPREATMRAAGARKTDSETLAALRQSFNQQTSFGMLVHRCADTVSASAGKPTYNPKLFDWLCRASILPEAIQGLESDAVGDIDYWHRHAVSIDRLMRFAEHCASELTCSDASKLIAQLINQQPVIPLPQYLNKISVERAPVPKPTAAAVTVPPTTQTN